MRVCQNRHTLFRSKVKEKQVFLLHFAHLIEPLTSLKVLSFENEKKNGFSFCILLT
jgi:hypothetical protein